MSAPARAQTGRHVGPIPLVPGILGACALGLIALLLLTFFGATDLLDRHTDQVGGTGSGTAPSLHPINPGTYHAGGLTAPGSVGGLERVTVRGQAQAGYLVSTREQLAAATGKPAIAAAYGHAAAPELLPVTLAASAGSVNPQTYLGTVGSARLKQSTVGPVTCASYPGTAVVCLRTDQKKPLTVVVQGTQRYLGSTSAAVALTNAAWKKLGG